ncbi:hypothetical protein L596_011145 [Steinernema carpocapsae]|uniref:Protein kinase domain-containing protein n=1 Tax=Steinernema carpocapsae TaxID=34508 RepID=A0A4U5NSS1_STECR|nr:hypothetical protein L596_011145 [Steinernema carpocapsae]
MTPLTVDCSGGLPSYYGTPFEPVVDPSTSSSMTSSMHGLPMVVPEEVVIYKDCLLGKGAYGEVVRGMYRQRRCAVKLKLQGDFSHLTDEAKMLYQLRHEGIVELYGVMPGTGLQGLVIEFMEGGSLHQLLHDKEHLEYTTQSVVWWALQCARALSHIHSLGFVHRDVKPLNLLLDNSYQTLKLCDFGTTVLQRSFMTVDRGTVLWMAPEVFQTSKYNSKADIFSFGITLWEMLTRKMPFVEDGYFEFLPLRIQWQKCKGTRPKIIADCIKPFKDLMTTCWAEEADERPDITDVVRILEILTEIYPVPSPPPFDLTTKQPAQAREEFNRGQANLLSNKLIGITVTGPRNYTESYLESTTSQQNSVSWNYVGQHGICTEPPYHLNQSSDPEYSTNTEMVVDGPENGRFFTSNKQESSPSGRSPSSSGFSSYTPPYSQPRPSLDTNSLSSSIDLNVNTEEKKEKKHSRLNRFLKKMSS